MAEEYNSLKKLLEETASSKDELIEKLTYVPYVLSSNYSYQWYRYLGVLSIPYYGYVMLWALISNRKENEALKNHQKEDAELLDEARQNINKLKQNLEE